MIGCGNDIKLLRYDMARAKRREKSKSKQIKK